MLLLILIKLGLAYLFISLIGYLIGAVLIPTNQRVTPLFRLTLSQAIGITLVPLGFFLLNHFLGLRLWPTTIGLGLISLAVVSWSLYHYRSPKPWPSIKINNPLLLICFCLGLCLMTSFQFRSPYVIGGDTFDYLYYSGHILQSGTMLDRYDRNIVRVFPAMLSLVSFTDLVAAMKIYKVILYSLSGLAVASLVEWFNPKSSLPALLLTYLSVVVIRLPIDIMAYFHSLIILTLIQVLIFYLIKTSRITYLVFVSLFWGSLFSLHGIVAYASFALVGIPMTIAFLKSKSNIPFLSWMVGIVLFVLAAQPLVFSGMKTFYASLIEPRIFPQMAQTINQAVQVDKQDYLPVRQGYEVDRNQLQMRFPAFSGDYLESYGWPLILLGLLGALLTIYSIRWHKTQRYERIILLIVGLGLFSLTQQQYLGLNWYTSRFVFSLYWILIPLALIAVETLCSYLKTSWQPVVGRVLVSSIVVYQVPTILSLVENGFNSIVNEPTYLFYDNLKDQIEPKVLVFSTATKQKIAKAINPYLYIRDLDDRYLCDSETNFELTQNDQMQYQAFRDNSTPEESLALLSTLSKGRTFYVILDINNECVNQDAFALPEYSVINQTRTLRLLKADISE